MLEIRKNAFTRSYENTFFREFAKKLRGMFANKGIPGVLLGSPLCAIDEKLQIDALLITPRAVCIIDFKNYSGKISLPRKDNFEFGRWDAENGEIVKGGNTINPFIQLKNQKKRFKTVWEKEIQKNLKKGDKFNPDHILRIVCFQEEVEIIGQIPNKEDLNFKILDKSNYALKILDLIDVTDSEINLSEESFEIFKQFFKANKFEIDETDITESHKLTILDSDYQNYNSLYDDQKSALEKIRLFIENPEQKVFILTGTTNSGKTFLLDYIKDIAFKNEIPEVELFAVSKLVSNNLIEQARIRDINSIYSYIYGGTEEELEEEFEEEIIEINSKGKKINWKPVDNTLNDEDDENKKKRSIKKKIIPLKSCGNNEKAIFVVDESHLLSDEYYESDDTIFGSGQLLKDFLEFSNLQKTKRKIIFIGDSFLMPRNNSVDYPLNPEYLKKQYELNTTTFNLIDKPDFSTITKESLKCVEGIRNNKYNFINFEFGDEIQTVSQDEIYKLFINDLEQKVLVYKNETSQFINIKIKENIIGNGTNLAPGDLIIINNNITAANPKDPFSVPIKIYNGEFAKVLEVSPSKITKELIVKDEPITIQYLKVKLKLIATSEIVELLSLENYRLSDKAEITENEKIAIRLNQSEILETILKKLPYEKSKAYESLITSEKYQKLLTEINELKQKLERGERVKVKLQEKEKELKTLHKNAKKLYKEKLEIKFAKDSKSEYFLYKNAALIRYGWALTVHKAMSYKFNEIIFDVEDDKGKNNVSYYRWLYTGMTRAQKKVYLMNYKPINPFMKLEINESRLKIANPKDIFFVANKADFVPNSENTNNNKENELLLQQFYAHMAKFLNTYNLSIKNKESKNYQEIIDIEGDSGKQAKISIYYTAKGEFKKPRIIKSEPVGFEKELSVWFKSKSQIEDFSHITDDWRREAYTKLYELIRPKNINIKYIIQNNYMDTIKLYKNDDNVVINLIYKNKGLFSNLIAESCTTYDFWAEIKSYVESIKEKY